MTIKNLIRGAVFIFTIQYAVGQNFHHDIQFLNHLEGIEAYQEALYYADQILPKYNSCIQVDSIHFLKGKFYYQQKKIPQSISSFQMMTSCSSNLKEISGFYRGFLQSYQGDFDAGLNRLQSIQASSAVRGELQKFEVAATYLLMRDVHKFDSISSQFDYSYYQLEDYQKDMVALSSVVRDHQKKSPFLAGLFSAIIPGAGRYYQGKIGQGTIGLVSTGVFALQAWEAYRKDGVKSARFIIFGGLFTTFYVANVWGSAVSVRVNEMRYNEDVDEAILVNMHLPIRLLFD